jgi:hypothetical protein
MKFARQVLPVCALLFCSSIAFSASNKAPEKEAPKIVDSGSFGVWVSGKRLATETFRMEQRGDVNTVSSQLRFEDSAVKVQQTAEMEVLPTGALRRYSWKETNPGTVQLTVEPQDQNFLVEHVIDSAGATPKDTQHPLSPFTTILDENFFSHVELIAWKYLAINCRKNASNQYDCHMQPQKLPVLVPHQSSSMVVTMQFGGQQKYKVHGVENSYTMLKMQTEAGEWSLWMNDDNKLVRIVIAADNTEVVRD